ncbi:MAG: hypothetical protein KY475_26235 [Planctomycetes bacterium]|nr:hypothetical protein [Planctomycetota bacterium]
MDSQNPYAPPTSAAAMPAVVEAVAETRPATQGKRFVNLIIDGLITNVLSTAVGFVLGVAYGVSKASQGEPSTTEDEQFLKTYAVTQKRKFRHDSAVPLRFRSAGRLP